MTSTKTAPPARRPGGRRPIPPLVFLLVLALLALVVWLKVLQKDETKTEASNQQCNASASSGAVQALSNLKNIQVVVLNGSGTKGLGAAIGAELNFRGFSIASVGNADQNIATVGEIHYGPKGAFAARVVAKHAGGFELVKDDTLTDATVQVVLGSAFTTLVDRTKAAADVKTVIQDEAKSQAAVAAGCASASAAA